MTNDRIQAVTGAFSYTGKYIARHLLSQGKQVITLVNHPEQARPYGSQLKTYPFNFDQPEALTASLEGAEVLYNSYWVRFDYGDSSFQKAITNTGILLEAARRAGVRRVVHISVSNADPASTLPYFRGKGQLEELVANSGLSYAILRPALIFGREDLLLHNIAWLLRRFPAFAIPGKGDYRVQPIFVEDLAALAVEAGAMEENITLDTIGPETFTFYELVDLLRGAVGSRALLVRTPPGLALALSWTLSRLVGDVMLTRDELAGLMEDLLMTESPPNAERRLSEWVRENAEGLGREYVSELRRHHGRGGK